MVPRTARRSRSTLRGLFCWPGMSATAPTTGRAVSMPAPGAAAEARPVAATHRGEAALEGAAARAGAQAAEARPAAAEVPAETVLAGMGVRAGAGRPAMTTIAT